MWRTGAGCVNSQPVDDADDRQRSVLGLDNRFAEDGRLQQWA